MYSMFIFELVNSIFMEVKISKYTYNIIEINRFYGNK